MRLMFFGSGEFGVPTFEHLRQRHEVAAVITQPDRPAGRGRRLQPTPVARWAAQHGLAVHRPQDANDPAVVDQVRRLSPQASVVIAFGQKLLPPLVQAMGGLSVNLHASLLPAFRGAAPINWAIIRGCAETGVSVISLAQRMDAGLIYAQAPTPIDPRETAGELHDRLAAMGPPTVEQVLERYQAGTLQGRPQDESLATRAPKLSRDAAQVDFALDCHTVHHFIHGLSPWPGVAVTCRCEPAGTTHNLKLLRVRPLDLPATTEPGRIVAIPGAPSGRDGLGIACGSGAVELLEVQPQGGKGMALEAFVRGHRISPGDLCAAP